MADRLGLLYASARARITAMTAGLSDDAAAQTCPATPEWTVHDVVAHVRGITEDVRTGNLEGVTTDPWTAAQVARHQKTSLSDLLAGWAQDAPLLESVLSSGDPDVPIRAVFDLYAHEADLRGALGLEPSLPDDFGRWAIPIMAGGLVATVQTTDLPAVRVLTTEGDEIGPSDAPVTLRASRFELFRSLLGRRSAAQVAAYNWGDVDPTPYLKHFFVFGPRDTDLVD
ncbi:MAG: maleylpyruvate isomerase family mycothiol-dependent enzyme [Actinomycetota bacterium]